MIARGAYGATARPYMRALASLPTRPSALIAAKPPSLSSMLVAGKRMCSTATVVQMYTKPVQWMHWVYAAGMLTVLGTVKASQWTTGETFLGTKGQTKGTLMLIHKSTAVILTALIVPRILLKAVSKVPAHLPGSALEHLAANVSHTAFYGFMLFMPATGIAMGWFGGKGVPFYGLYMFPGKPDKTKEDGQFAGKMFKWHKQAGQFMYYLVPLHVGAAGLHVVRGHPIFTRMNPFAAATR
eukprot:CAMPEP_0183357648 /NCGR_PEP_ID=MMETSP0164_2-20130417/46909_1 /TAXON_ID=221442 /ORGANISM="Coccolithus pelagicus ssp braarudi, Strain PLY182g" /LENGTH=239 /DNA_ID=CAMNT_0025531319 /DNA_START=57 /DNA_END=776 /DNA_ORIENTATION=-